LKPFVDGKAPFAFTRINQQPCEMIISSALFFASLASLAPLARAQQCDHNAANFTFDSIYTGDPYQCTYNQNAGDRDLVKFSFDNIGGGAPDNNCHDAGSDACRPDGGGAACAKEGNPNCEQDSPATPVHEPGVGLKNQPPAERFRGSKPPGFNRDIYYKNKLEFSLEGGWLPINIPFPLDALQGDPYDLYPLRYTLVPIIASLRWQMGDIGGPWILRGNWDLTCSGSFTAIPKGPETRYFAYIMGIRRNFVPRNWRAAPYLDLRLGLGDIDAKGPKVRFAQGQDFTFTAQMGSGARYNFNPRISLSAGMNYMHISNAGLSGKKTNYGINVYGPMVGIDVRLRRRQPYSEDAR
jgi:hypothetical protein